MVNRVFVFGLFFVVVFCSFVAGFPSYSYFNSSYFESDGVGVNVSLGVSDFYDVDDNVLSPYLFFVEQRVNCSGDLLYVYKGVFNKSVLDSGVNVSLDCSDAGCLFATSVFSGGEYFFRLQDGVTSDIPSVVYVCFGFNNSGDVGVFSWVAWAFWSDGVVFVGVPSVLNDSLVYSGSYSFKSGGLCTEKVNLLFFDVIIGLFLLGMLGFLVFSFGGEMSGRSVLFVFVVFVFFCVVLLVLRSVLSGVCVA